MKRNGRSRTGVAAKRRRRRIALKLALRAQLRLVKFYADAVVDMQRQGGGPVSPYLPFDHGKLHPTVRAYWAARGGSWRGRRYAPLFNAEDFFDIDREPPPPTSWSNLAP